VVPVTRMVYSKPDVNTAVLELAKGPSTQSPLERALPAGCGLIDVKVEDGVAKVNFTREFADLVENTDGGRLALKALVLTCTQFEGIEEVEIFVEGQGYDPGVNTLNVPTFANVADDIVYETIQAQSNMIFDFE
jgi:germination protein M